MENSSYSILVPLSFTPRDHSALKNAIDLSNHFQCDIHLVHLPMLSGKHLFPYCSAFLNYDHTIYLRKAALQLKSLKEECSSKLTHPGKVEISLLPGKPLTELSRYINAFNIDMVIMGLPRFNLLSKLFAHFHLRSLIKTIQVPILAVKGSYTVQHFRKIILPARKYSKLDSIVLN